MKGTASAQGVHRASAVAVTKVPCLGNISLAVFPGAPEQFPHWQNNL